MRELLEKILKLGVDERIQLAQDIWDSIVEEGYDPALSPEEEQLLERRLASHRENPNSGMTWEEVKASLKRRGI